MPGRRGRLGRRMHYRTLEVDRSKLIELMRASGAMGLIRKIIYRLGAKARFGAKPGTDFKAIDCSGFVRWILNGCTDPPLQMPDGSWRQRVWCQNQGFKRVPYDECGRMDSRLRIAFIDPTSDEAGHAWLVVNGQTIESRGGRGPSRRLWDTPVLKGARFCFVLTDPLP